MKLHPLGAGLILTVLALPLPAQTPPRLPAHGPAPLLHVQISGPPGLRVTFYPGSRAGQEYAAFASAGLRPGYVYRVKLTGYPRAPGQAAALYPSLEVLGTLQLPPGLRASDFPVTVHLSADDIDLVLHGALLTKVFALEHPAQAFPTATSAEQPLEVQAPPGTDPVAFARTLGRPLLVVRLGERELTAEELAAQAIPGTVLLPGDRALALPRVRPWVPWACWPVYDPVLGPRPPEEECLHDGGDRGTRAGLDAAGRVRGLDAEDTVAAYSDSLGGRHLAISNRVCVCSPRFVAVRSVTGLEHYDLVMAVGSTEGLRGREMLRVGQGGRVVRQAEQPRGLAGRERPSGIEAAPFGASVVGRLEGLAQVIRVQETGDVTGVPNEVQPPDRPLVLCKSVDRPAAPIGEVVTFTLRYTNTGGQPITDVVVSDSLSGRLEYVPGSWRSDRDAAFTTEQNEAGSLILHWQITGRLLPGQSGLIRFQARIR
jgi:uncharacterized repeat protein (TIGR01451 family)